MPFLAAYQLIGVFLIFFFVFLYMSVAIKFSLSPDALDWG